MNNSRVAFPRGCKFQYFTPALKVCTGTVSPALNALYALVLCRSWFAYTRSFLTTVHTTHSIRRWVHFCLRTCATPEGSRTRNSAEGIGSDEDKFTCTPLLHHSAQAHRTQYTTHSPTWALLRCTRHRRLSSAQFPSSFLSRAPVHAYPLSLSPATSSRIHKLCAATLSHMLCDSYSRRQRSLLVPMMHYCFRTNLCSFFEIKRIQFSCSSYNPRGSSFLFALTTYNLLQITDCRFFFPYASLVLSYSF